MRVFSAVEVLERQPANVPALYKPVSANGRKTAEKRAAWEKRTVIDCRRWSCALPHRSGESSVEATFLESFSAAKLSWKLSKVPRDRQDRQWKIDNLTIAETAAADAADAYGCTVAVYTRPKWYQTLLLFFLLHAFQLHWVTSPHFLKVTAFRW